MSTALEFRDVDILFSPGRGRRREQALKAALQRLDAGDSRAEISTRNKVVVGVAGANLTVERGEICVLMGLSGSGKSTLLRAANGLNPVSRGHVLVRNGMGMVDVADCDVLTLRHVRRERVAMVFQQFGLLPWRTVAENVGLGLELRGVSATERRAVIAEKLELVGLTAWADRYAYELSGGMQQRVGLARAFATDAEILLMDEPFSALDPLIRGKLQDELLALQERVKKTILFVSHDLDEALKLGDRISIMEGGRIIQTGTADDILLRPANDYVAEFVRHMNPLTVLTGAMIMRKLDGLARRDGGVVLDLAGLYHLTVDADNRPLGLTIDGAEGAISPANASPVVGVATAPSTLALQAIIQLRHTTGHPVLLVDHGVVVGVCDECEIIRALAMDHGERCAPASPA
ncbi:choline ABC transporter ATP-binding protein [soil metagenome]